LIGLVINLNKFYCSKEQHGPETSVTTPWISNY